MNWTPEEALKLINNINKEDFSKKISGQKLSKDREEILFSIIKNKLEVGYPEIWDIQRYALQTLYPEHYVTLSLSDHIYSNGEIYEYDPPKNGKNIIKHGISFGEVYSFSEKFGTLNVPCPDANDQSRYVIFSDLLLGENGKNLSVPIPGIIKRNTVYTLSIAKIFDKKIRLISSRVMSRNKNKYRNTMDQAFKNIYNDNPAEKKAFVNRCIEIIETHLFKENPNNRT